MKTNWKVSIDHQEKIEADTPEEAMEIYSNRGTFWNSLNVEEEEE